MTHAEVAAPQQTTPPLAPTDWRRTLFVEQVGTDYHKLHNFAQTLVGPNDAPDAVQNALASTYRALDRFTEQGENSMGGWLYRAVYNASLNVIARRTRRWQLEQSWGSFASLEYRQEAVDPSLSNYVAQALSPHIRAALAELPVAHQDLLVKVYAGDMPLTEYARSINVPYGTALSRSNRAKHALRKQLARTAAEEGQ